VPHIPSLPQCKCNHCLVISYRTCISPRCPSRAKQRRDKKSRPAYLLYNILYLLRCNAVLFGKSTPTFRRNILPPFSGSGSQERNQQGSRGTLGRAIALTVSRWLPTAAARVRARVWSCGVCGGQVPLRHVFSKYFGFSFQSSFHQLLHNHHNLSSGASTIGQ
jgi:hypothetical protein